MTSKGMGSFEFVMNAKPVLPPKGVEYTEPDLPVWSPPADADGDASVEESNSGSSGTPTSREAVVGFLGLLFGFLLELLRKRRG
jgi:hypothetical protein